MDLDAMTQSELDLFGPEQKKQEPQNGVFCPFCNVALNEQNASKLQSGEWFHIGCPRQVQAAAAAALAVSPPPPPLRAQAEPPFAAVAPVQPMVMTLMNPQPPAQAQAQAPAQPWQAAPTLMTPTAPPKERKPRQTKPKAVRTFFAAGGGANSIGPCFSYEQLFAVISAPKHIDEGLKLGRYEQASFFFTTPIYLVEGRWWRQCGRYYIPIDIIIWEETRVP